MSYPLKVLTIFGTRPEAIKMAPVLKALKAHPDRVESRVCVTAQHRQMLDQVLELLDIVPEQHMAHAVNPHSDGHAAEYIVKALLQVGRRDAN